MTDMFDRASDLEMAQREAAIEAARAHRAGGPSRTEGADCGEPIPPARQQAVPGVRLCIACQTAEEYRGGR